MIISMALGDGLVELTLVKCSYWRELLAGTFSQGTL
jgi:hypothetical protein